MRKANLLFVVVAAIFLFGASCDERLDEQPVPPTETVDAPIFTAVAGGHNSNLWLASAGDAVYVSHGDGWAYTRVPRFTTNTVTAVHIGGDNAFYAGTVGGAIFISLSDDKKWVEEIDFNHPIRSFLSVENTIYVCGDGHIAYKDPVHSFGDWVTVSNLSIADTTLSSIVQTSAGILAVGSHGVALLSPSFLGQWKRVRGPGTILACVMINADIGIAVGEGRVWRLEVDNGRIKWTELSSPTDVTLRAAVLVDHDQVIIAGHYEGEGGQHLNAWITSDSGDSWTRVCYQIRNDFKPAGGDFHSIYAGASDEWDGRAVLVGHNFYSIYSGGCLQFVPFVVEKEETPKNLKNVLGP